MRDIHTVFGKLPLAIRSELTKAFRSPMRFDTPIEIWLDPSEKGTELEVNLSIENIGGLAWSYDSPQAAALRARYPDAQ